MRVRQSEHCLVGCHLAGAGKSSWLQCAPPKCHPPRPCHPGLGGAQEPCPMGTVPGSLHGCSQRHIGFMPRGEAPRPFLGPQNKIKAFILHSKNFGTFYFFLDCDRICHTRPQNFTFQPTKKAAYFSFS